MAEKEDLAAKCLATRVDGLACRAYGTDSGLCFWHDPTQVNQRKKASRRGGSRRALSIPISEPLGASESCGVATSLLQGLLEGSIDPKTVYSGVYLLNLINKLTKNEELEKRITSLEKAQEDKRNRGRA